LGAGSSSSSVDSDALRPLAFLLVEDSGDEGAEEAISVTVEKQRTDLTKNQSRENEANMTVFRRRYSIRCCPRGWTLAKRRSLRKGRALRGWTLAKRRKLRKGRALGRNPETRSLKMEEK